VETVERGLAFERKDCLAASEHFYNLLTANGVNSAPPFEKRFIESLNFIFYHDFSAAPKSSINSEGRPQVNFRTPLFGGKVILLENGEMEVSWHAMNETDITKITGYENSPAILEVLERCGVTKRRGRWRFG
jgi:hypothetical protein